MWAFTLRLVTACLYSSLLLLTVPEYRVSSSHADLGEGQEGGARLGGGLEMGWWEAHPVKRHNIE